MNVIFIFLGVAVVAFLVIQIMAIRSRTGIERYAFKVVERYTGFEVRTYEASLFTAVTLPTNDYKTGSSLGFSALGGYIFGANDENKKISMTSPVTMSLEDSMTVMFMVPKKYTEKTLPKPNKENISFKEEPAKTVAAITFGGWADSEKIANYKEKLTALLDDEGIAYTQRFFFLGYNPPYDVFGRKNEIIVELEVPIE